MIKLTRVLERPLVAAEQARALRLPLPYDERVKSRLAAMSSDGRAVAIVLADHRRGSALRDGSVLASDDGQQLAVVEAAPQLLARVRARAGVDTPLALLRAAYHLANRHVPAQLAADELLIERDPVLEPMLRSLGLHVEHVEAPFDPEPGAYDGHAHGTGSQHAPRDDDAAAGIGEQLSIEAHRRRA